MAMDVIEGGNGSSTGGGDDIDKLLREAQDELTKELNAGIKRKLTAKLREIASAKKVLANLELELEALMRDLKAERAA